MVRSSCSNISTILLTAKKRFVFAIFAALFFLVCISHITLSHYQLLPAEKGCVINAERNFVFIAVKSSSHYHAIRLPVILNTWIELALKLRATDGRYVVQEVTFITDGKFSIDEETTDWPNKSHLQNKKAAAQRYKINPQTERHPTFRNALFCGTSHYGTSLACKMVQEFRAYFAQERMGLASWFCHFDDDTYVNMVNLLATLKRVTNPTGTSYIVGKVPSHVQEGVVEWHVVSGSSRPRVMRWLQGQAVCLSQQLMRRIKPLLEDNHPHNFVRLSERNDGLADDLLLSMVVNEKLKVPLTEAPFWEMSNSTWSGIINAATLPFPLGKMASNDTTANDFVNLWPDLDNYSRLIKVHNRLLELSNLSCIARTGINVENN